MNRLAGGRLGRRGAALVAGLALLSAIGYGLGRRSAPADLQATLSLAEALGDAPEVGFARALAPRPFVFPADHGPHPEYRTEWWYYTGSLDTAEGRHLGFQLTFFRIALTPRAVPRSSAWGATQMYMAHFAVSDAASHRFHAFERLSREALGLAGARAAPFRVWVEDWRVEGAGPTALPMRLRAAAGAVSIDLQLDSVKPPVLHGERGLSRKSTVLGAASYYYSLSRMPARGTVRVDGETLAVQGLAWMDREWSTSALAPDQAGWDWFALQLADGRDIMFYQLRRRDGGADPASRGSLIEADGARRDLASDAVRIEVLDHWVSPRDGTRYPARWRFRVPASGVDLTITPYLADQELALAVRYWEGAVRVDGTADGRAVRGAGYVELTGYTGSGGGTPAARRGG